MVSCPSANRSVPYPDINFYRASPRLKDADIPASAHTDLYVELILMVRRMFHECKLVHADLSEYNILYHIEQPTPSPSSESEQVDEHPEQRGHLYIIDVSQSVEHDHPHAFDFLRADVRNVEDFFSKRGARTLGLRRTFEFITTPTLEGEGDEETILKKRIEEAEQTLEEEEAQDVQSSSNEKVDDEVFMKAYIPRTLNEVFDPERDVGALARGEGEKLIYKDTIGIVAPKEKDEVQSRKVHFDGNAADAQEESEDESGDESEDSEDSDGEEGEFTERTPRGHRHEDKESKKVMSLPPFCLTGTRSVCADDHQCLLRNVRKQSRQKLERSENTRSRKPKRNGRSKQQHEGSERSRPRVFNVGYL